MTDPTPVDEIVVVGQRRRYTHETFPSRGGGGGGDGGFIEPEEVGDGTEPPPTTPDPCADPETALEWNADAAAAEAFRQIIALANQMDGYLGHREFGAFLYRRPDGSVGIGPITWGRPFNDPDPVTLLATVELDYGDIDPATVIGTIHTHNMGSILPSNRPDEMADWQQFDAYRAYLSSVNVNPDVFRIYLGAQTGAAYNSVTHRLHMYNHTNRQAAIDGTSGPEVNPEAQPCP